jgi:hypothetical protein
MQTKQLRELKTGEFFKRKEDANAVYCKGHYDIASKSFSAIKYDDINAEIFIKANKMVFVGFDF